MAESLVVLMVVQMVWFEVVQMVAKLDELKAA
jgi:hypothetical protein